MPADKVGSYMREYYATARNDKRKQFTEKCLELEDNMLIEAGKRKTNTG